MNSTTDTEQTEGGEPYDADAIIAEWQARAAACDGGSVEARRLRDAHREERAPRLKLLAALRDNRPDIAAQVFGLQNTMELRKHAPKAANDNSPYPGIVSSADFISGFVPPDYHLDGVAQAGFIYALTASTGTGKTAVMLALTSSTALGTALCGRDVRKGRVLYLAGENRVLEAERATLGKSKAERAAAIELARIGTVTDDGQRQKIMEIVQANEALRQKIDEVKKSQKGLVEAQNFFGDAITDSLGDLILDGEKATDVVKNLAKALAKAALQAALIGGGPLAGLFGTGGSNGAPGGLIGTMQVGFKQ